MGRSGGRSANARSAGRRPAGGGQTRRTRPTGRSGHARPASGRNRRARRVSWPRRLGIAAALLFVVGASVVLAGQALAPTEQDSPATARPTAGQAADQTAVPGTPDSLPIAPVVDPPAAALVSESPLEITGQLTQELPRDGRYRLRIYVNGEMIRDRRLPRRDAFTLPNVPLAEGRNSIALAIHGPAGESLHSTPIEVVLDSTPPQVVLVEPQPGPIWAAEVTMRGTSEPGARLTLSNLATGGGASLTIADDGLFELTEPLVPGPNELVLVARDAAGNEGRTRVTVERREGQPEVRLSLSRGTIALAALPTTLTLRARVLDAAGQPVNGAEVTLSLSPPGLPTQTYQATTSDGNVLWSGVRISGEAQRGQGLATVMVVLPTGETLQESVFFTIE